MKIIVATDSFKDTLSSEKAGRCIVEGFREHLPENEYLLLPVSDGGEGLCETLTRAMDGEFITINTHDALMRPIKSSFGYIKKEQTAIIEIASTVGLTLLSNEERSPMHTTSYGFGEMIAAALNLEVKRIILGIGGSATVDAGIGMLMALGYKFFSHQQPFTTLRINPILEIDHFEPSPLEDQLKKINIQIACDVDNPLCGRDGAAYIFARQKGATEKELPLLDEKLKNYANLLMQETGHNIRDTKGAGAGGGVPASLTTLFGAKIISGAQLVLETLHFSEKIADANLIITGEGQSDSQTLHGKIPFAIMKKAKEQNKSVYLLSGSCTQKPQLLAAGFDKVIAVSDLVSIKENYMQPKVAAHNLKNAAKRLAEIEKWH